jgi:hypothetical protein
MEHAAGRSRPGLVVRIVHVRPGRIHAKVPREAFEGPALREVEAAILNTNGVREIRRNARASSVVVH